MRMLIYLLALLVSLPTVQLEDVFKQQEAQLNFLRTKLLSDESELQTSQQTSAKDGQNSAQSDEAIVDLEELYFTDSINQKMAAPNKKKRSRD